MKIYDISQEIFSCRVYPGDPTPERKVLSSMERGGLYNLTAFSMCAHNGTHLDAPFHFFRDGKTVEQIPLEKTVGKAFVVAHAGTVTAEDAAKILETARNADPEAWRRILIKGEAEISLEAAEVFADARIDLIGNESQSVGPLNAPMSVHLALLSGEIVLLEGICLEHVPEGVYMLNAAPLAMQGADGSPCRAILIDAM